MELGQNSTIPPNRIYRYPFSTLNGLIHTLACFRSSAPKKRKTKTRRFLGSISSHVQIKDVCSTSINCRSVCVWYIWDMLLICTSALESTYTQQVFGSHWVPENTKPGNVLYEYPHGWLLTGVMEVDIYYYICFYFYIHILLQLSDLLFFSE